MFPGVAKRTQHVVPNNVARCCVEMLRAFGQAWTARRKKHETMKVYANRGFLNLLSNSWALEVVFLDFDFLDNDRFADNFFLS